MCIPLHGKLVGIEPGDLRPVRTVERSGMTCDEHDECPGCSSLVRSTEVDPQARIGCLAEGMRH
ncbi:hypothetical protein WI23_19100 [Burkholderia oklahomensis C6786]|nr:hypothetical protein WI23_19100 [Burkholderia oklahomensis C6786]KUY50114.1 hypothetical protein WI23_02875 [Burkholderia oklahomensis C6786]